MKDEVKRIIEFELSSPLARHVYITNTKLSGDMGHLRIRFVMHDWQEGTASQRDFTATGGFDAEPATINHDHGTADKAQVMLDRSAGYVARVLCDVLQLRKAPKIVFSYDKEYAQMKRVRELLDEDRRSTSTPEADSTGEDADAPGETAAP